MGKKRDLANEHIEELIDLIVDERQFAEKNYCCYKTEHTCINDCENCKDDYYEKNESCNEKRVFSFMNERKIAFVRR